MFITLSSCNFFRHIALVGTKIPMYTFASHSQIFSHVYAVGYLYQCNLVPKSVSKPSCIRHLPDYLMRCAAAISNTSHRKFLHFQLLD